MLNSIDQRKKGQALIELIPSLIILVIVISAMTSWFRATRSFVIREEVVRNTAFATISNVGTLTTPFENQRDGLQLEGNTFLSSNNLGFISEQTPCVVVFPSESSMEVPLSVKILKNVGTLNVNTYAVLVREPSGCRSLR